VGIVGGRLGGGAGPSTLPLFGVGGGAGQRVGGFSAPQIPGSTMAFQSGGGIFGRTGAGLAPQGATGLSPTVAPYMGYSNFGSVGPVPAGYGFGGVGPIAGPIGVGNIDAGRIGVGKSFETLGVGASAFTVGRMPSFQSAAESRGGVPSTDAFGLEGGVLPRAGDEIGAYTPMPDQGPDASAFHSFFQIWPEEPEDGPVHTIDSIAVEMQAVLTKETQNKADRALRLFKEATTRNAEDRIEKLSRVADEFASIRRLHVKTPIPLLVTLHASLTRGQTAHATHILFDLVLSYPRVFADRPNIGSLYGDEELFKEQMLQYARLGESQPNVADAFALQAYCAWALGDMARAAQSITRADELAVGTRSHVIIQRMRAAMEAAMLGSSAGRP
jgi:hypothetical protein